MILPRHGGRGREVAVEERWFEFTPRPIFVNLIAKQNLKSRKATTVRPNNIWVEESYPQTSANAIPGCRGQIFIDSLISVPTPAAFEAPAALHRAVALCEMLDMHDKLKELRRFKRPLRQRMSTPSNLGNRQRLQLTFRIPSRHRANPEAVIWLSACSGNQRDVTDSLVREDLDTRVNCQLPT